MGKLDNVRRTFLQKQPSIIETPKPANIVAAIESLFLPIFRRLESWNSWLTFLKSLYGLPLDSITEIELFKNCTGREYILGKSFHECYAVVGRRGGKSFIASVIAVFEALFGGWEANLTRGERAHIFCIAVDKNQAQIVFSYIKGLMELFPDAIEKELRDEIELKNGITITTKPCTYRASRGFSTCCVICDEVAFWRDENSTNPAEEVINSILPGLIAGGKLLGITTPYAKFGYLYETYKENFAQPESDILVWKAPTLTMNPLYNQVTIERLLKRDRAVFSSEYFAEFREDIETFLPESLIREAMTNSCALPFETGKKYVAFIDPSGGRSDSMTMAICHREGETIVLNYMAEVRPPFDPAEVTKLFSEKMKEYGITRATSDRYGGIWVTSAFQKNGILVELSELDKSQIYLNFQPLLSMKRVRLIDDERLLVQLQALERRVHSGGKDSVDHAPGMHDDLCNSVAGAIVLAAQGRVLTAEQMEKFAPRLIKIESRQRLLDEIRGKDFDEEKKRRSAEQEMDEWMRSEGGSRIVKS